MKKTLPTRGQAWKKYKNEFGLYSENISYYYNNFDRFCDRILQIGDFVASKDGVPLEEPINYKWWLNRNENGRGEGWSKKQEKGFKEYQQALDRVIFKIDDFTISTNKRFIHIMFKDSYNAILYDMINKTFHDYWDKELKSISDLCNKVDLTDKEYKRLGL